MVYTVPMPLVRQRITRLVALATLWLSVGVPVLCIVHCHPAAPISVHAGHTFLCDPLLAEGQAPAAPQTAAITPQLLQALMLLTILASAALTAPLHWVGRARAATHRAHGIAGSPLLQPPR